MGSGNRYYATSASRRHHAKGHFDADIYANLIAHCFTSGCVCMIELASSLP